MPGHSSHQPALRQALRRMYAHLLRRTALLAMLGVGVALLVVSIVGADSAGGQVGLVVIGTLISLALLPDEPHRLWNVNARTMAETIPNDKLSQAGSQLAGALALQAGNLIPTETMNHLWTSHLNELERVAKDPTRLVSNLDYRISMTPRSDDTIVMEADIDSTRFVPGETEVYVSLCSNLDALMFEFGPQAAGCLLREMVYRRPDETPAHWIERTSACRVDLRIDGQSMPRLRVDTVGVGGADASIVRLVYPAGPLAERFCPTQLAVSFENPNTGEFAVKFSSYYCVGSTRISFELRDTDYRLEFNEYLSTSTRAIDSRLISSEHSQKVTIVTTDQSVLPPGSGVVFQWVRGRRRLLETCEISITDLPEGVSLPAPCALPEARRSVADLAEPLVEVSGISVLDAYAILGVAEPRPLRVRSGVQARLLEADHSLPPGFTLVLLDGWRSAEMQRLLIHHYSEEAVDAKYVADLSDAGMRAPHLTGGAVDVTIAWEGKPLALGTDFDSFDVAAHLNAYEGLDSVTRRLRRMLSRAMTQAGFAPYPFEWWHWSYGDDVWAETTGAVQVRYECIET